WLFVPVDLTWCSKISKQRGVKEMKKVRWLSITLILALIFALSACSGGGNEGSGNNGSGNGSGDSSGDSEPVNIVFRHENSKDWGGPAVKKLVENFNKTHDNIQVEGKYTPNNYQGVIQKIQSGIAGGNPPDVAMVGYNFITLID